MSLDEEERAREREQREAAVEERRQAKRARPEPPVATAIPQTLMAAYSADEAKRATLPKNLFFYTLASSPSTDERGQRSHQIQVQSTSSESMGVDAEPEPYFEPRARKAKLRCQAAQPVKYGYNYADMNAFPATRYAPLYSYHESSNAQQAYASTNLATPMSPTTAKHIPHIVAYPHSHRQATPSQPTAVPFPSVHGQLPQAAATMAQIPPASPASYGVCAVPHFRDDVWARPPLPPQALQQQNQLPSQSPNVCVMGPGQIAGKWGRQSEEQVIDYSDSPAVQSATHGAVHSSSPYRHRYASTNASSSSSHHGSAASSPYYHQRQNIHRQIAQDVPSAPFANAGPPGVGVQFYSTPEVQQVHVQMPISMHMPVAYNTGSYAAYSSSSAALSAATASTANGSALPHTVSHGSGYTYSGAHSTSNSPYHSASSGLYRYGDYGYSGQTASSAAHGKY